MGGEIPKQFRLLQGKPILFHTLTAFQKSIPDINLILVLPKEQILYWETLCENYQIVFGEQKIEGGKTRFQSVRNGLKLVPKDDDVFVAVHDGVRPLVSATLIQSCFQSVDKDHGVIPVVDVKETLVGAKNLQTVDRSLFKLVQTPQVFPVKKLKDAYDFCGVFDPVGETFTDDSSVFSKAGHAIKSVTGEYSNIKITTPEDLQIADALLTQNI